MEKIRVLVVDDSSTMRRIITTVLSEDPQIEVVGTAANGKLALEQLALLKPDIITLDIEMPEMNGLETVPHIRKDFSHVPIIMFSSLTETGASYTLDALALGASDYVTKPSNLTGGTQVRDVIGVELIGKIKALAKSKPKPFKPTATAPQSQRFATAKSIGVGNQNIPPSGLFQVVAIGVSTGGPMAIAEVLARIPGDIGVPIVVVQHMPPTFTRMLAERLNSTCSLTVVEARDGEEIKSNHVYIAPGGFHMVLRREAGSVFVRLNQEAPENSCRPAVDVLFRSVAEIYGGRTLAVILTGMGQDGLRGSQRIKELGGTILAQDEETSVVWGMPGAVTKAGITSAVLPLPSIADEILRLVRAPAGAALRPL